MPLSEKARVEVYLPDLPKQTYQNLLEALEEEFTYTFGGSTAITCRMPVFQYEIASI